MIDKNTYKKELMRMFAWVRDDDTYNMKECNNLAGKNCNEECPIRQYCFSFKSILNKVGMTRPYDAFEVIEAVEKWSKEQKHKISQLEYDILKYLSDNTEHIYITRDEYNCVYLFDEKPKKSSGHWYGLRACSVSVFNELFQFVQWEDEKPTLIQDVLRNCEVVDDDTDKRQK